MSSADRQRRLRIRQRDGKVVAPLELSHEVIDVLIDLGWVGERESEDRRQVGIGAARALEEMAHAYRRKIA